MSAGAPPARPPTQTYKNSATKHLCAAAYLDREFRDKVLDEVYFRPDRAVAPSPGLDTVPVVRHARRARALDTAQHCAVTALLFAVVCALGPMWFFVYWIAWWQILILAVRACADIAAMQRDARPERRHRLRMRLAALVALLAAVNLPTIVGFVRGLLGFAEWMS